MIVTYDFTYPEVVGTDAASQFRGWVVFKVKTLSLFGISQMGVKKMWVDYFN